MTSNTSFTIPRSVRRLFAYALLVVFALTTIFPFLWMLSTTFKSRGALFSLPPTLIPDLLFKPEMWESYITVLTKYNFLRYAGNSFFVAGMAAVGQLFTASLAGFAFARMQFKGKGLFFGLLLSTTMIPTEVVIIPEFLLMARLDWLDTYLPLIVPSFLLFRQLRILDTPVALVLLYLTFSLPFAVWSLRGNTEIFLSALSEAEVSLPESYAFLQNYPNPFNARTRIRYDLPAYGVVHLAMYNLSGQLVRVLEEGDETGPL